MGKLYDNMVDKGVYKNGLKEGGGSSMCIVGHIADVYVQGLWVVEDNSERYIEVENEEGEVIDGYYEDDYTTRYLSYMDFLDYHEGDVSQEVWDRVPNDIQEVVLEVIHDFKHGLFTGVTNPWTFNDDGTVDEDDIMYVGKLIDERINELGLDLDDE